MNTTTLHAHVNTYSVDCDGPISRDYVMTYNDDERAEQVRGYFNGVIRGEDHPINDFSEISFRQRVLSHVVSAYTTWQGTLTVTGDEQGGLTKILDWSETTEEGGHHIRAEFCSDDCDTGEEGYRDYRAEAAGY